MIEIFLVLIRVVIRRLTRYVNIIEGYIYRYSSSENEDEEDTEEVEVVEN